MKLLNRVIAITCSSVALLVASREQRYIPRLQPDKRSLVWKPVLPELEWTVIRTKYVYSLRTVTSILHCDETLLIDPNY
jgi:hypothetical protein